MKPERDFPDAVLFDEDAFGQARAVYYENRDRFVDRLLCAQYFDAKRFEAMRSLLVSLRRFHEANAESFSHSYFDHSSSILNHLEIQSKYSKTQKDECAQALSVWKQTLRDFSIEE